MKLNKSKNGISLIVLVITIVVMIILAATIVLTVNSNNIVGRAHEAKTSSDKSMLKEAATLHLGRYNIKVAKKKIDPSEISADEYVKKELKAEGLDTSNLVVTQQGSIYIFSNSVEIKLSKTGASNIIYTDKNSDVAIIPEGFMPSEVSGEDTVKNGLVIYEGTESITDENVEIARETRNQFVWIPVENIADFAITRTFDGNITSPGNEYGEPYAETSDNYDPTGEYKEHKLMYDSVKENGGFYIGRYEAGTDVQRLANTNNGTTNVVVQKNKYGYKFVGWGKTMLDITGDIVNSSGHNQGKGAVELSRSLYNTNSVKSTLTYGVQYDAAVNFISKTDPAFSTKREGWCYDNKNENPNQLTGIEASAAKNVKCNIYDMVGNLFEWTMEADNTYHHRVLRGGYYSDCWAANQRYRDYPKSASSGFGFRVSLYIK